ncbi:sulfurtransferase [Clostridium sp.]|uniref:sulfurtransferase n=1 Tax=Clostridium sp. TaxID=1506 RepID=UPI001A390AA1|nr:sulfurtransferase [Clostridium sp.]MBK5234479.1 sulfurtransferase [Clostridium sp.]
MKFISRVLSIAMILSLVILTVGCGISSSGKDIISAKQALDLLKSDNVVIVAAQTPDTAVYDKEHVKDSVKIDLSDIVINIPVVNMLAPKEQIEKVMGELGISSNTTVLLYDTNNNMDAARVWWTLKVYGHENVKVVSGGFEALKKIGAEITSEVPEIKTTEYVAKDKNNDMIAGIDEVKAQATSPDKNTILLDTRSQKEYAEGTIPGSVLLEYINNDYSDGTYKPVEVIKIQYIENNIKSKNDIIMYCKTSIRGAQTYLALYNAGYRNLKLYDGAWAEWSSKGALPVQKTDKNAPAPAPAETGAQDAS